MRIRILNFQLEYVVQVPRHERILDICFEAFQSNFLTVDGINEDVIEFLQFLLILSKFRQPSCGLSVIPLELHKIPLRDQVRVSVFTN